MNNRIIKVKDLKIKNGVISAKIICSDNIRQYFLSDYFYAKYSEDIKYIPQSILCIPVISTLITVAWAIGADIFVDEIDKAFLVSLNKIQSVFKRWYPHFSFSTKIITHQVVSNSFDCDGYLLYFSGGVDSMSSYIHNKHHRPELFTVWGADIPFLDNNTWEKVNKSISSFSEAEKLNFNFVKTNMRQMINEKILAQKFGLANWWACVANGLILIGLSAPFTVYKKIKTVLFASTYTKKEFDAPLGSHPLIDNNIKWADVDVFHDGYELNRQEKTRCIAKNPKYLPYLRVCFSYPSKFNCGLCEKCVRTMISLVLEGINPGDYNFNVTINKKFFDYTKKCFLKGVFNVPERILNMWTTMQQYVPKKIKNDLEGSIEFFIWFKTFDFKSYHPVPIRSHIWKVSYIIKNNGLLNILKKLKKLYIKRLKLHQ